MFIKLGLLTLIVFAEALSFSNCKTTKPTSDSTAPVVKWSILHKPSNQQQEIMGDGTIAQKPDETLTVTFIATDPEGIHEITLGGGGSFSCIGNGIGQNTSIDQKTDVQTLNPDSAGNVLTQIFLIRDVDLNAWKCNPGFTFNGGSLTLIGTGENYFHGKTTAQLTINRPK